MSFRRVPAFLLLTVLLAGPAPSTGAQAPAAPPEPQGPTIAQLEEQARVLRASLKNPSIPPETWGALIMTEVVLLNLRAQKAAGGAPVDPAALAVEQRKIRDRVFAEWKAARPDDATPYLSEMQGTVPPEHMDDAVLALLPRFPDDPRLLNRVTQILCRREQAKAATDLIEAALERHPDRAEFYSAAFNLYRTLDNEPRQREIATAWIERLPGDANALGVFLGESLANRDPKESAARVERFVATGGADPARVDRCGWLLTADQGAYRDAAVRCLNTASEQTRDPQLRARAATFLAATGDGTGDLEHSLAGLPRERRLEAILNAIHTLGEGQCEHKAALLGLLPWDGSVAAGTPSNRLGALHGCETDPAARAAFLDAVARGPADDLRNLLYRWFTKVNGHYLEDSDFGLAPRVVAALEERKRREAANVDVWLALDEAYQLATWDDRRAAHLAAWTSSSLAPPPAEALTWLADYREGHDGTQAGVDTLRLAWHRTHDVAVAAALADHLLAAGRMEDFGALVDELGGSPQEGAESANEQAANLAHLLRARGALLHHDFEAALAQYGAYVDRVPYLKSEEAAEYILVVAGVRGAPAAEQAAESLCAKPSLQSAGATATQCAASLLSGLGHARGALQLLEAAAQRAPEDLRLQSSFAMAAEQAGAFDRAEQAYRRMLAVDPKSETYWSGLARMAERRSDPGEMESLLRQAEQARGDQPSGLVIATARVYLAHQQPERAIDLLTALRHRFPDAYLGEDELRQAYRDLSAATPRKKSYLSPRAPVGTFALASMRLAANGGGGAQPPSVEDLRAMREAENASLGIGGPMDEAKARAIVKRLAPLGNAYANIRLSIWQQAGTQGYTKDARQSAATAQPYLPALHAAAEAGEPYAEYLWGTVLLRGIAVPKQAAEGGVWLRKAAERNEPWALNNLGWMAENGDGANKDLQEALRWYRRGAEAGNVRSMMSMATLRLAGEPKLHQGAEGAQWLAKAAEKGLPEAVSWYGPLLLYGNADVPAHPESARPWLEKAAAAGNSRGLTVLGVSLVSGLGGPVDEKRGVALLQQGAEKGNTVAMWQLVWQLALGQGVPRDGARAEQWIERAAAAQSDDPSVLLGASEEAEPEAAKRYFTRGLATLEQLAAKGDAFAGGLLSRFYQMGTGVKQNPARAVAFARPAAAAGSTEAMRVLGWAYRLGEGVEADAAQAASWWRRGAEGGNSYCMMWYSQMLFKGQGGRQDSKAAMAWLERASEKGNSWSINDLGNFYDAGVYGLPRDEKKAAFWKRKALGFGNEEARGWLIAHHMLE